MTAGGVARTGQARLGASSLPCYKHQQAISTSPHTYTALLSTPSLTRPTARHSLWCESLTTQRPLYTSSRSVSRGQWPHTKARFCRACLPRQQTLAVCHSLIWLQPTLSTLTTVSAWPREGLPWPLCRTRSTRLSAARNPLLESAREHNWEKMRMDNRPQRSSFLKLPPTERTWTLLEGPVLL